MDKAHFELSIPTDNGFLGRECNSPTCRRYFKVHANSINQWMYCPYCGSQSPNNQLYTDDQCTYIQEAVKEKALEYAHDELSKMFNNLARKSSNNKFVQIKFTPSNYRAKPIIPHYREREVDSELICPDCNFRFQVFGIFGYCPGCRTENMRIYDADLAIIKQEIAKDDNPQRALRHAYSDLVSTFELFCKKNAKGIDAKKPSFQELFPTRKFFKDNIDVDILTGLKKDELLILRRIFQKRHAYEHNEGMITDRYVKKIPEDAKLLDTKAILSIEEFELGANILRRILDKMVI